jgi:2-polyprenyl-3-methyl-5-hydroxy-6-metoxy-1,4-benzoquinol methylase
VTLFLRTIFGQNGRVKMSLSFRRHLERIYHDLVLGPRGYGRSVDSSVWEKQYRCGEWSALQGLDEMAHYAIIGGYTRLLHPAPAILDAGCGGGELLKWMNPMFSTYLGIDISEEAIAQANALNLDNASFAVGDLEKWDTPLRFDIIVFNESLYYTRDPRETLSRFNKFLKPAGAFILSMCEYGHNAAVWSRLDETVEWLHGSDVRNCKRQRWEIRVGRFSNQSTNTRP